MYIFYLKCCNEIFQKVLDKLKEVCILVVTMYIVENKKRTENKEYTSTLLVEGKKVKHRAISIKPILLA